MRRQAGGSLPHKLQLEPCAPNSHVTGPLGSREPQRSLFQLQPRSCCDCRAALQTPDVGVVSPLVRAPTCCWPCLPAADLRVLDLGSGSGRDCYLAAALVGPSGQVIGVRPPWCHACLARHGSVCCLAAVCLITKERIRKMQMSRFGGRRCVGKLPLAPMFEGQLACLPACPALSLGAAAAGGHDRRPAGGGAQVRR